MRLVYSEFTLQQLDSNEDALLIYSPGHPSSLLDDDGDERLVSCNSPGECTSITVRNLRHRLPRTNKLGQVPCFTEIVRRKTQKRYVILTNSIIYVRYSLLLLEKAAMRFLIVLRRCFGLETELSE